MGTGTKQFTGYGPYTIVKRPVLTEKYNPATGQGNTYSFVVDKRANKIQIREAIEMIYKQKKIKVVKVNTMRIPGKLKRVGKSVGSTNEWKKALVTLREGDSLDLL